MDNALEEERNRLNADLREAYSKTTIDHILRPRNSERLPQPDGFASCQGSCGEKMEIWIKARDNIVVDAGFLTDGCAATIACGSMSTELAKGKSVAQALAIKAQDIAEALVELPDGNFHCAELASNTLRAALHDYIALQRNAWKKAYRKQ